MANTEHSLLSMAGIHKRFPGVYALKDVHFDVKPGEIHALMGENGAGKSTLIKIMSGAYAADEGEYRIDGADAGIATPHDAIAKGVCVIYQELNLAGNITVAENIAMGALPTNRFGVVNRRELRDMASRALEQMELDIDLDMKLGYLPIAQQQLVEIAKAIFRKPRVLIMDEPTSALSAREIDSLFQVIKRLAATGVGVVYVSHKIDEIFRLCDRVSVLRDGQWIGTKPIGELDERSLVAMMVGREMSGLYKRERSYDTGRVVLEVRNLGSDRVRDISFAVKAGEIVGFFGLMGAGRTELARAIFGADERLTGEIVVDGRRVPRTSTRRAAEHGLGFISENRKDEGILPTLDVRRNMTIASIRQFIPLLGVKEGRERSAVSEMIEKLKIKTFGQEQNIANLSGGNQQKVLIARWLIKSGLKVLIVDEPTRGIDVGAKAEIYALLDELAKAGMGIVCISSEMNEILSICDRVYIMKQGRISGECSRGHATSERLFTLAAMGGTAGEREDSNVATTHY